MAKELLFKVTAKDCRWDYYVGSGKGGQARNKTENCVRCTHEVSGAVGKSEDGRSKELNKRTAFERMCKTKEFQLWCRREASRVTGEQALIEAKVDQELLHHTKVEVQGEDGKWQESEELKPNHWDIKNLKD